MAQYFTDFSGETIGNAPSEWSELYTASGTLTLTIRDGGGGEKYLELDHSTSSLSLAKWDNIDADANRDDVEIYAHLMWGGTGTARETVFARGTESAGSVNLYQVDDHESLGARLGRYVSSSFATIATDSGTRGSDVGIRLRVNGTTLQCRVWDMAGSEPGTWDIDTTDANVSGVGAVGVHRFGLGITELWAFGVGTNGDSAPTSDVGGGGISIPVIMHNLRQQGIS